jgi:hypothetical protein
MRVPPYRTSRDDSTATIAAESSLDGLLWTTRSGWTRRPGGRGGSGRTRRVRADAHVRGRGAQPRAPLPTRGGFGRSPTRARAAPWDLVGPPRGVGALADTTALGVSAGVGLLTDACRPREAHRNAPQRRRRGWARWRTRPVPRQAHPATEPHQRPGWARTPRPDRAQQAHRPRATTNAQGGPEHRGPTAPNRPTPRSRRRTPRGAEARHHLPVTAPNHASADRYARAERRHVRAPPPDVEGRLNRDYRG